MHFKDDPISDMQAKNYFLISLGLCLGPQIWSRLLVPAFPARSRRIQLHN